MDDEDAPQPTRRVQQPALDTFGVAELNDYIAQLRTEIARAEATIARKSGHRTAADAVFGRLGS